MKMRKTLIGFSVLILLFTFTVRISKAAPDNNPIFQAITELESYVNSALATIQSQVDQLSSDLLALTDRVTQNETDIAGLTDNVDSRFDELEERVNLLENPPTPTPTPTPVTFQLVDSKLAPAVTDFNPPDEYETITFKVTSTSNVVGWAPAVSFDGGISYFEQVRISCGSTVCPEVTVPLLNTEYYRFQTGSSSGLVSVEATYNNEDLSQVLTLGEFVNYPFTSSPFNTDGYSNITITVGGGDNPQHVTGISLQRLESGSYVQKEFQTCDGGAICPITTFPLLGGDYRVELQGSGTKAVIGAILRP
jgi:hypothetical protein